MVISSQAEAKRKWIY